MEIHVCVGMDWNSNERQVFKTHLQNEWTLLQHPPEHLLIEWIDRTDPYFSMSVGSLEKYRQTQQLSDSWWEYLVLRSGSCLEYVQMVRLYNIICSQQEISKDDLLLRTRTDVLLRHSLHLDKIHPTEHTSTREIFQQLFPTSSHFSQFQDEPQGREVSIFHSSFQQDRWVITLRKNLFYIMPMTAGIFLEKLVSCYGDWDTPEFNAYWFNAESQFRGCFRKHHFTVWEYSQQKDECHGDFNNLMDHFPIYAIYR